MTSWILEIASNLDRDPLGDLERLEGGGATVNDRRRRRVWREAYVAGHVDHRMRTREVEVPDRAVESLDFSEFDQWCHEVWTGLGHPQPLYVSPAAALPAWARAEMGDADASARWAEPPSGVRRTGSLAGTTGPVGYIDVETSGQLRMVGLHEIAHLIRDEVTGPCGHDLGWADVYVALLLRFLDQQLALDWVFEWTWWLDKSRDKLADNVDWLMEGRSY